MENFKIIAEMAAENQKHLIEMTGNHARSQGRDMGDMNIKGVWQGVATIKTVWLMRKHYLIITQMLCKKISFYKMTKGELQFHEH